METEAKGEVRVKARVKARAWDGIWEEVKAAGRSAAAEEQALPEIWDFASVHTAATRNPMNAGSPA